MFLSPQAGSRPLFLTPPTNQPIFPTHKLKNRYNLNLISNFISNSTTAGGALTIALALDDDPAQKRRTGGVRVQVLVEALGHDLADVPVLDQKAAAIIMRMQRLHKAQA